MPTREGDRMINPGLMAYNVLEQRAKAAGGPNAFCDLLYRQGLEKGISIGEKTGCTRNLLVGLIAGGLLGGVSSFCLQELLGFDRIPLTMQRPISLLRIMILGIEKNEELAGIILFCSKFLA